MTVRVPAAEAETAAARLLERFPGGLEERAADDRTELAVFTDEDGEADVRKGFADVSTERVEPGWEDRWKEFHRPVSAGGLWIGPPWIEPPAGQPAVVVDPGRAFGTGAHPTTRACIALLARLDRGSLLDAGCGSGVVAVAAARLGFAPVAAIDVDEVAVEIARETAHANGVEVTAFRADVLLDELPLADVVVANIELAIVEQLLQRVASSIAVTSGYLQSETPTERGWTRIDRVELDGWAADVLRAK
ncbi:MAG TPA: 50S ribosomal protein L11 methyltransferase [Gaiellaceae bacterium]|nr:50S ribosomal protein L11 methyltransferase [Gaiellaceae bacterium]